MKFRIIIVAALLFSGIQLSAQLRVNKESIIRNAAGSQISLEELMELMKSKKYTLSTVPGKDNEFIVKDRVGDEPTVQGTGKPFYGEGDFYDNYFGKKAPDFKVTTTNKKELSLSDLKGKTIVMNFWFTHCKPCLAEIPELNKMVEKFKQNKDVIFLAVALENIQDLRTFLNYHQFNYQHTGDAKKNGILGNFGIESYPTNIIIDKEGIVRYAATGAPTDNSENARHFERMAEVIQEVQK
jgi:peroxiredoxin